MKAHSLWWYEFFPELVCMESCSTGESWTPHDGVCVHMPVASCQRWLHLECAEIQKKGFPLLTVLIPSPHDHCLIRTRDIVAIMVGCFLKKCCFCCFAIIIILPACLLAARALAVWAFVSKMLWDAIRFSSCSCCLSSELACCKPT